jgi:hypothetical protein
MSSKSNTSQFFDAMYLKNHDPWEFATSPYEQLRYATIFNALSHQRYKNIFEPGCSIGILTQMLSKISDSVQAFDISEQACLRAKKSCIHLNNVIINCESLQTAIPRENTNLIIFSEIGYYFTAADLDKVIKKIISACSSPLTILASHWLGKSDDHLLNGDEVNQVIGSNEKFVIEYEERNDGFRLDRWCKK